MGRLGRRKVRPAPRVGSRLSADGKHHAFAAADGIGNDWFLPVRRPALHRTWHVSRRQSRDGKSIAWAASPYADGSVDLVRNGVLATRADIVMAPPWNRQRRFDVKRGHSVRRVVID